MNQQQRAKALFRQALELPNNQREDHLQHTCAGDGELLRMVRELLAKSDRSERYLIGLASRIKGDDQGCPENAPASIGRYRLGKLIGQGGMGAVYLAERDDGQFEQAVALKLLPNFSHDPDAERRFLNERQILAKLQHPHICRLLDGGIAADRRPYFVMDLVDGNRVDDYCDASRLSLRDRLRLFLQVGEAVQYAHANLVLHRDIKPANILIDSTGAAQLLDFGVAKVLDQQSLSGQATNAPLTPNYASPEVVSGSTTTTASDIYSLGVLLYRLLIGVLPHDLEDLPLAEALAVIRDVEAPRAGRRFEGLAKQLADGGRAISNLRSTTPPKLSEQLNGDIENILGKSLALKPTDRYRSAQEMADDVQRYLDHRPVLARAPTASYVAGKFVRRHQFGMSFAAFGLVALIALAALTAKYVFDMDRQSQALVAERDRAEAVSEFLVGMFRDATPNRARSDGELTARSLIDTGVEKLGTAELIPETRIALLSAAGKLYGVLSAYDESLALLSEELDVATELYGSTSRPVANVLEQMFIREEAAGRWDKAEDRGRQLLSVALGLDDSLRVAYARTLVARMSHLRGDLKTAGDEYRAAHKLFLPLESEEGYSARMFVLLSNYAALERQLGNLERSEALFNEGLIVGREAYGDDHVDLVAHYLGLGNVLTDLERFDEARVTLLHGIEIAESSVGPDADFNGYLRHAIGRLERQMQNYPEAEAHFRRSLAVWEALVEDHPYVPVLQVEVAKVQILRDNYSEATVLLESARTNAATASGRRDDIDAHLGYAYFKLGEIERGERLLLSAHESLKTGNSGESKAVRVVAEFLVELFDETGRPGLAAAYRRDLLANR